MTTTVPKVFAFHEFARVAEAVADHVVHAQNTALEEKEKPSSASASSSIGNGNSSGHGGLQGPSSLTNMGNSQHVFRSVSTRSLRNGSISQSKNKKIKERRFKIAISGGSLIQVLHEGLLKRRDVRWDKWDIYFADERLVPFESPESNYGQAKRQIFDMIDTEHYGEPNVYHINEALIVDPQECADDYEKALIRGFAGRDSVKLPMFDLLLLGCAPDGHIASLFPNFQESLRERFAWVIPVTNAPSGPPNRLSLTIPVICHSHQVTFVVEGATKAPVIKTIMERPEKGLPSSIVNEGAAGRVSWFVDNDALTDVMVTKKVYKFLVTNPNV
ncbi:AER268Wp [Eremothecium gossypii ATCC 10895]|uniref:AER268Wp n=1 Tax=Eremothecium gossypii (strain ATCC 10895 / CBS 109.51 / FGSC 9923 / NRRL Y-1056) TaxID=284811 RepID=Q756W6_EREGS|nr:AER268Wp [Eremothecium gossypii ATCC 10895]AAS52949.1 AER268Wp [Eremothecium gossypii ATCC 10895]AEY97256.1 FAER268Wp [Eremothecium gossypii FDAG1]